jgi:hypothetical protein
MQLWMAPEKEIVKMGGDSAMLDLFVPDVETPCDGFLSLAQRPQR